MPEIRELEAKVSTRVRITAARMALVDDDRLSICEVLRGITGQADFRLVSHGLSRPAGMTRAR